MNKDLKDLSFNELSREFPVTEGIEVRENDTNKILVPYKEIRVVKYEMPKIDFSAMTSAMTSDTIVKPHRTEIRIRIYEEDVK